MSFSLALRNQNLLPWAVRQDWRSQSVWSDAQGQLLPLAGMNRLATSKQVVFVEK